MHVISFLQLYGLDILIVAIVLVLIFLLCKKLGKRKLLKILPELIQEAENILGSKTGKLKKKQVIAWLFRRYPFLALITTDDKLSKLIDDLVSEANTIIAEIAAKQIEDVVPTQEVLKASVEGADKTSV